MEFTNYNDEELGDDKIGFDKDRIEELDTGKSKINFNQFLLKMFC
jgi:hypothetical protein